MGWSTFEERLDKAKINYRVRLEHMDDKRWAKKVFKWRGRKSKFYKQSNRSMDKIGMKIITDMNINSKEIKINGEILEGERKIQDKKKKGLQKWKDSMENKIY